MGTAISASMTTPGVAPQSVVSAAPAQQRRQRRWSRWLLAGGVAAGLIVTTLIWRQASENRIRYETVVIEQGSIQSVVTATGTLNAVVDVQVGSQVSGNIKALYADFNTKVKKGQLVALIDPAIFQSQVRQAEATLSVPIGDG